MYGWIWKRLPGNRAARTAQSAGLAGLVAITLWFGVFPTVENHIHFDEGSVDSTVTIVNGTAVPAEK